jgi:CMP-N,N'-diacetyllegionaminic acid synthase
MLAIIPARAGSKGIKNKNLKLLNNKHLIEWTIIEAIKSKLISRIIVSTDSSKIAEVALKYNDVEVPFLRPKYLASNTSKAIDTYLYTIDKISKKEKKEIEEFIILLPTSPLRSYKDIDTSIKLFRKKKSFSLISFIAVDHPSEWNRSIIKGKIILKKDNFLDNNRQKYKQEYRPNGAIYIFNYQNLKTNKTYYSDNSHAYIMDKISSVDIDDMSDFKIAELLLKSKNL